MNVSQSLRKRINFQGDFEDLLSDVVSAYKLGKFDSFEAIEMGYEDVNLKLLTTKGKYFVKIFADTRDEMECLRLVNIVKTAIDNGVSHPRFLIKEFGYIFKERYENFMLRLAVFEFVDGKTFYELGRVPTLNEQKEIIKKTAIINRIDHKPQPLYDSWAILNFPKELEKTRKHLSSKELLILNKLNTEFLKIDQNSLPHTLVHGDLISTNIIKSKSDIYFVDFSVANYYPRITELAVLMCDILFDPTGKSTVENFYKTLLSEYQKYIKLTPDELKTLPLFIKIAHAMHIVGATREKAKGVDSIENEHWLELGKKGLTQTLRYFK